MNQYPLDTRSILTKLNQRRWSAVGQLTSTAALLESLQFRYPNLRVSWNLATSVKEIREEAERLNAEYRARRDAILSRKKRKEGK